MGIGPERNRSLQLLGLGRNWVRFAQWVAGVPEGVSYWLLALGLECGEFAFRLF